METEFNEIEDLPETEDQLNDIDLDLPEDFLIEEDTIDNLAEKLSENDLMRISSRLLEAIDEDIAAAKPRRDVIDKAEKYLGFSIDDIEEQSYKYATRTYDSTLANSLIRNVSKTISEFLSAGNQFVDYKINTIETPELVDKAEKLKKFFNYYLDKFDKPFRRDFEKCIHYNIWEGSAYKKVYYDPNNNQQKSRFILPNNFIVDSDCISILESERLTHVLYLSKRQILENQQAGIYRDISLSYLKTSENIDDDDNDSKPNTSADLNSYTKRSLFPIYEIHTYLDLSEFSNDTISENQEKTVPLPYIVIIDKQTKKVLGLYENWLEDETTGQKKRKEYFVQYNYITGFGLEGLGLAQLLGGNAITLTRLLRSQVDAGLFSNLPGGLRMKGMRQQNNDIIVGPGQWSEIDTNGIPLREFLMPLPYRGADNTLKEMMLYLGEQTNKLGSVSELSVFDSKEDIPTANVLAAIESHNHIQSAVFRSMHHAFSEELMLLYQLFKDTLNPTEFFDEQGVINISAEDFDDNIIIIPAADPGMNSSVLKLIKAETILNTALKDPQAHNNYEAYKLYYKALGLTEIEIDTILPAPQEQEAVPLDPVSENANLKLGKPVKAGMYQAHDAHILGHGIFAEENPDVKPSVLAHIREHEALKYLVEMQQKLGYELPPMEVLMQPEVQNKIAFDLAQLNSQNDQVSQEDNPPLDQNTLILADIEQKRAEIEARERIENKKIEAAIFKAQLDFEKEKAKIQSNEYIAQTKAETELTKQQEVIINE